MQNSILDSPITVLGAGSWGTALAVLLAKNGQATRMWGHENEHIQKLKNNRMNQQFLPGVELPEGLELFSDLEQSLQGVRDVLIVVPSFAYRNVLEQAKPFLSADVRLVSATKGLDPQTGQLLYTILESLFNNTVSHAVLAGPSFAKEVGAGMPTAVTVASKDKDFINDLNLRFSNKTFRVYSSDDVIGVELGGVVKNVIAIATGISDGLNYGANTRAALITRGLAEMMRLGQALGANPKTFMGLAGIGDLLLTATDNQSRNRRFGLLLGQGKNRSEAEDEVGQVVEGANNAKALLKMANQQQIDVPIIECVYRILYENLTAQKAVEILLSRETGEE